MRKCDRNYYTRKEYILKIQNALGKPIPKGAEVHHIDGNPFNNLNSNLVLCQSHSYHILLHDRAKTLNECGDANKQRCFICGEYKNIEDFNKCSTRTTQKGFPKGTPCKLCKRKIDRQYKDINRDEINRRAREKRRNAKCPDARAVTV